MSKESFHQQALDIVLNKESHDLMEMMKDVVTMKSRAEKSNTTITWNEYNSAQERVDAEIFRLTPPEDQQLPRNPNRRNK